MGKKIFCHCGKPATLGAQDLKQVDSKSGWVEWERLGPPRFGCDEHPPVEPVCELLDGTIILNRFDNYFSKFKKYEPGQTA